MPVKVLSSFEEFKTVINSGSPVIIDFWATWCGPCRMISPTLEKLSDEPEYSKIQFYKVDIDDAQEITQDQKIRSMPTFTLYKDGIAVESFAGAYTERLQNMVKQGASLV